MYQSTNFCPALKGLNAAHLPALMVLTFWQNQKIHFRERLCSFWDFDTHATTENVFFKLLSLVILMHDWISQ